MIFNFFLLNRQVRNFLSDDLSKLPIILISYFTYESNLNFFINLFGIFFK